MLDKDGKEIVGLKREEFQNLFHMQWKAIADANFCDPAFYKHEIPSKCEVDHVRDRGWWTH